MLPDWTGTVVVALIGLVAAVSVARLQRRGNDEATLRERIDRLEKRERIRDDYIHELRDHISDEKPPPPPPWPDGLTK